MSDGKFQPVIPPALWFMSSIPDLDPVTLRKIRMICAGRAHDADDLRLLLGTLGVLR